MEIKEENGTVTTTMTFSECYFGVDDPEISTDIINRFNEILCYPNQPERLSPEGDECNATLPIGYEEGMEPKFTFDVSDSLNQANK